jgi:hypothetical protein
MLKKSIFVQGHPTTLYIKKVENGGWELESTITTHPEYSRVDYIDNADCIPVIVDAAISKVKEYLKQQEGVVDEYTLLKGLGFE